MNVLGYDPYACVSGFVYENVRMMFFSFCWISLIVTTSVSAEKLIQLKLFEFSLNRVERFLQRSCEISAITLLMSNVCVCIVFTRTCWYMR